MTEDPDLDDLDDLFAPLKKAICTFRDELAASKRWLAQAEQTESQAWRRSFLRASRAALERALGGIADFVAERAPAEAPPLPPDAEVPRAVTWMRDDLNAHRERLGAAEAREAESAPLGQA